MQAVIASSDLTTTLAIQTALDGFDVHHIDSADQALLEAHLSNPLVVVIHADLRGTIAAVITHTATHDLLLTCA